MKMRERRLSCTRVNNCIWGLDEKTTILSLNKIRRVEVLERSEWIPSCGQQTRGFKFRGYSIYHVVIK